MTVIWAMSRVMAGVKGGIGHGFAASLVPPVTCKHVRVICAARQLRHASLPRRHLGTCDGKCCGENDRGWWHKATCSRLVRGQVGVWKRVIPGRLKRQKARQTCRIHMHVLKGSGLMRGGWVG